MVKKLKQMADKQAANSKSAFDSALAGAVKESAQQIWLAGMGAFAKAQAEGGKVFETLVKEGVSLQRKTQSVAEGKISEVTSKVSNMASMAGEVGAKAGQQWDKLESIFEERVARSLNKLGVPSAKDVNVLIARIDALSKQVAQLSKAKPAAAPRSAAKPTAKPAAKKSVKPAAKKTSRKAA
jgi:poly(hydroxyalkanoate) granule-associated protein